MERYIYMYDLLIKFLWFSLEMKVYENDMERSEKPWKKSSEYTPLYNGHSAPRGHGR